MVTRRMEVQRELADLMRPILKSWVGGLRGGLHVGGSQVDVVFCIHLLHTTRRKVTGFLRLEHHTGRGEGHREAWFIAHHHSETVIKVIDDVSQETSK